MANDEQIVLSENDIAGLQSVATSIRSLSIDAIQKAGSGHPGLPLGAAEIFAILYGSVMNYHAADSKWLNKDRFILSAGHGSSALYAVLHLAGFDVTLDDIKNFRQVGSRCPGHPEYGVTDGVECTTGPLGQGVSIAVGCAVAETMAAAHFNTSSFKVIDNYTYALVGEGCLEEGVSSESASFAGAMGLGKLIVFYDENKISIDGPTDITFNEDVEMRYKAYKWQVLRGSMYDLAGIASLVNQAKADTTRPTLIILSSKIGKYSPLEGSEASHGAALGVDNVAATKKTLSLDPTKDFQVLPQATEFFKKRQAENKARYDAWQTNFQKWAAENPVLKTEWDIDTACQKDATKLPDALFEVTKKMATRAASGAVLNELVRIKPNLVGGSADLTGPNKTALKGESVYSKTNRGGRYIEFGIREFAMSAICAGISLYGFNRAFCATFLVFADYLRAQIRLSSMMHLPLIYILTHDSIYVGEDGPTHQSVESLASLRCIPGVHVLRPADAQETAAAWEIAINTTDHPVCLVFTRQDIEVFQKPKSWRKEIKKGAYIAQDGGEKPDITILATGSEVSLALEASKIYAQNGGTKSVRVVSILDYNLFVDMTEAEQQQLIGGAPRVICAEAGVSANWQQFASSKKDLFCIDRFGMSGPGKLVAKALHFTTDDLAQLIAQ